MTYGASGSTRDRTITATEAIAQHTTLRSVAHLTCASQSRDQLRRVIGSYAAAGVRHVLAIRGDLARQAQRTAFALAALMVGSAAYLTPVEWAKAADGLLLDGVTQMQEGFLSQVGLGDRDTLPTVLVDRVVYDNWVRGEFGSPDVPQAQQLGRNLLRAQTFTKQEVAEGRDNAALAEQKKADFAATATSRASPAAGSASVSSP